MYKVFPQLVNYKVDYSWGGTLAITINRLPNFGTMMNNKLFYALGYSGHGLALSVLAGKLISEKINDEGDYKNRKIVLAKDLQETLINECEIKNFEIEKEFLGKDEARNN